jgi:hypothetical protein
MSETKIITNTHHRAINVDSLKIVGDAANLDGSWGANSRESSNPRKN